MLNLLDDTPVVPGDSRPPFEHAQQARQVLNDAEADLREWTPNLEPVHSSATHMGANLMPNSLETPGTSVAGHEVGMISEAADSPAPSRITEHGEGMSTANQIIPSGTRDISGSSTQAHAEPTSNYQQ